MKTTQSFTLLLVAVTSLCSPLLLAQSASYSNVPLAQDGQGDSTLKNDETINNSSSSNKTTLPLGKLKDGDTVALPAGSLLELKFPSNRTTGYSWNFTETTSNIVQLMSRQYVSSQDNNQILGRPGHEVLTFRGLAPGDTTLTFTYSRIWEKSTNPVASDASSPAEHTAVTPLSFKIVVK